MCQSLRCLCLFTPKKAGFTLARLAVVLHQHKNHLLLLLLLRLLALSSLLLFSCNISRAPLDTYLPPSLTSSPGIVARDTVEAEARCSFFTVILIIIIHLLLLRYTVAPARLDIDSSLPFLPFILATQHLKTRLTSYLGHRQPLASSSLG